MSTTIEGVPQPVSSEKELPSDGIHLTRGRLLAKNTVWNLLGQVLPMLVGVVAVPLLVHRLGVDRFGVLSLAWIVIGYFGLFDLGIGRALTKLVADKLALDEHEEISTLVWTSLALMLALGSVGTIFTLATSSWLVESVLKVPIALRWETIRTFHWLAFSIPLATVTSGLRGVLQAKQKFAVLTAIQVPFSTFTFLGPLLVLPFSNSLVPVVLVLIAGRLAGLIVLFIACRRAMPSEFGTFAVSRGVIGAVMSFGGWMTVTNVVGPLMTYMDRFLIGSILSVGSIAYYTAPYDLINRLSLIPTSLTGVLFPALAVSYSQKSERTTVLLDKGEKYIFIAIFPMVLLVVAFAPEGLRLWLGDSFARNGAPVLRYLAAGVLFNSLAQVPFAFIQSMGRPDITARLHLLELPVFLTAIWQLTRHFGIEGTAIAWACRCTVDAVILFALAHRLWPRRGTTKFAAAGAAGLLALYVSTCGSLMVRGGVVCLILAAFGFVIWRFALDAGELSFLLRATRLQRFI